MKKQLSLILLFALLSVSVGAQHLFTEKTVNRGEVLRAYVYPSTAITSSRFILSDEKGKVFSDSEGYSLILEEKEIETSLLGIPSHMVGGKYLLKVFCQTKDGSYQFTKPIFIEERQYLSEEIKLSGSMTELRSTPDPQKSEQSRKLWTVISGFERDNTFCSTSFEEPVKEYISSAFFGDRRIFVYSDGTKNRSLHNGSDFAAPTGEKIFAAGRGKVVMSEKRIITGNTIILEHLPGFFSLYYHLDSLAVEEGKIVEKGEFLGAVGATGLVTGPHLHFEVRISGVAVDPLLFFDAPLIDKDEIMDIIKSIL